jgi:hypothetical protein
VEVKAWKVAWGAVWQRSIVKFFEHFEGFSEHGIATCQKIKPMILMRKNGLFTIERE